MAMDYTTGYAQIVKYDKNEDGTLTVYGKATDDTLDLDSQICDPKWLDNAMPRWFKSGGNIREMHGPSAAGIAKEYEAKSDGHYINVLVVDPLAAKKVETGVYQGFSIGIKSPRVIQDSKAANGRIIDGQIIEVSLVDRPANPSAKLILAKAVEGESSLVQVEELIETESEEIKTEKGSKMEQLKQIEELAKSLTTIDVAKFDKTLFDNARRALAELIAAEALEMKDGHDERYSLATLAEAVNALMNWYTGEEHEGEIHEMTEETKADMPDCEDGKCGKCAECMSKAVKPDDSTEEEESDQAPDTQEDDDEVAIDDKKKSADAEEATEETTTEDSAPVEVADVVAEETPADAPTIEEVVEKAVKSALKSVEAEMVALRADKEAAVTKAVELETELTTALTKAVAGGPKRTATKLSDQSQNDALVKAATFKAKMDATTDPLLYKGYKELRDQELRKAGALDENN